ncbi:AI-2E family transporter [Flavobacterium sp.]|uniref:AI-2E family transporter n=1 Tax=Flavobacterium sp. TaxID=239 RepID=UPI00286BC14D|nr:AI-2E family transporter [Flavobacterium sp.]
MTTTNTSVIKKLLLIFLIFSALYFAKQFLMPLFIGGILATLFLPFSKWMESKKIPRSLAVFFCLLALLLTIALLISVLGWKMSELFTDIDMIKEKAIQKSQEIQTYIFNNLNISIKEQDAILKSEKPSVSNIMEMMFGSIAYVFSTLILVLVYYVFLLYYRTHIRNFFLKVSARSEREEMEQMIDRSTHISQQYLLGLLKMIVCLWIMYGIGFSIIGVENAIFFAILCGILEIVPFVGNIIGTTITVLVTSINGGDTTLLIGIIATYGIVQFIQGWVLEPLIVGAQVKINALFTIIALIIGELIWGIPGIILAIPLTAIFKIMCDHIESLKPYGFLIGEVETRKSNKSTLDDIKIRLSNLGKTK